MLYYNQSYRPRHNVVEITRQDLSNVITLANMKNYDSFVSKLMQLTCLTSKFLFIYYFWSTGV
jgi:hypothetical protein